MYKTGTRQTKVVMMITKIQSSQDASEIKESYFMNSFMLCFSSPQNTETSVSMKKQWLFNKNVSTFQR